MGLRKATHWVLASWKFRPGRIFWNESKPQFQKNLETEKPRQELRHKDKSRDTTVLPEMGYKKKIWH